MPMAAVRSGLLLLALLSPCYSFGAFSRSLRFLGGLPGSTNDVNVLKVSTQHTFCICHSCLCSCGCWCGINCSRSSYVVCTWWSVWDERPAMLFCEKKGVLIPPQQVACFVSCCNKMSACSKGVVSSLEQTTPRGFAKGRSGEYGLSFFLSELRD